MSDVKLFCIDRDKLKPTETSQENTVGAGGFPLSNLKASGYSVLQHAVLRCHGGKINLSHLPKSAVILKSDLFKCRKVVWISIFQTFRTLFVKIIGLFSTMTSRASLSTSECLQGRG